MTQEDKDLLLKDLCARLPYNIMCDRLGRTYQLVDIDIKKGLVYLLRDGSYVPYSINQGDIVKPYLRSMSSMTEEERIKIQLLCDGVEFDDEGNCFHYTTIYSYVESFKKVDFDAIDWLLANHFDFRGLIPLGLAIEVTENNNPYKN